MMMALCQLVKKVKKVKMLRITAKRILRKHKHYVHCNYLNSQALKSTCVQMYKIYNNCIHTLQLHSELIYMAALNLVDLFIYSYIHLFVYLQGISIH